jgi:hypothetical protein
LELLEERKSRNKSRKRSKRLKDMERSKREWERERNRMRREYDYDRLLKDDWSYDVDNSFALEFVNELLLPQPPPSSRLCQRCSSIQIWSDDFELLLYLIKLRNTADSCEFCSIFYQVLRTLCRNDREAITVSAATTKFLFCSVKLGMLNTD